MERQRFVRSRRGLHGVAEALLAGPQYVTEGTIRLRVTPGGFSTVSGPEVRVEGVHLLCAAGRVPLAGTFADVARAADLTFHVPDHYRDHSDVSARDAIDINNADAAMIADWFVMGAAALTVVAPEPTPVLWPEHFDLGVAVDEVNYGVSPGDGSIGEPYAYAGPWSFGDWQVHDDFWNAPFGAVRSATELPNSQALVEFFERARDRSSKRRIE